MDLNTLAWRKAKKSGGNGGDCVEVSTIDVTTDGWDEFVTAHAAHKPGHDKYYLTRDSKQPDNAPGVFTPTEWAYFTEAVSSGEFADM
jgi:hypothetical protein